jgi:membrane protein implicated in regulation of membrane protease activity
MQFWNSTWEGLTTIATAIVAVALLALLVSKKSDTAKVIQAMGSAFGNSLAVAVSPVTGNDYQIHLEYPNSSAFGELPSLSFH